MAEHGTDQWAGTADSLEDPEEKRVICCALDSYIQYAKVAHFNVTHLRRQSFYALPQAQWQMLASPPFNFLETLDRVDDAIESNARLARAIAKTGIDSCGMGAPQPSEGEGEGEIAATVSDEPVMPREWQGAAKHGDVDKAKSTIRQFYRDWSAEGASERAACYDPIFEVVEKEKKRTRGRRRQTDGVGSGKEADTGEDGGDPGNGSPLSILVPGAGLGRLVFELCLRGCDTEGNEISYHQLLASSYILNYTQQAGQHTIYPWIHSFSNHRTRENHLRGYAVPDVHPATAMTEAANTAAAASTDPLDSDPDSAPSLGEMSMCAADFLCLYSDEDHSDAYDVVATVFFLDTAPNLIRYLETIYHCLRPGGVLVNVGPLLWHFENDAPGNRGRDDDGDGEHDFNNSSGIADPGSFELADDEVMALVQAVGFVVEERRPGAIEAPYIQDAESMLQNVYMASFWVARKPEDSASKRE